MGDDQRTAVATSKADDMPSSVDTQSRATSASSYQPSLPLLPRHTMARSNHLHPMSLDEAFATSSDPPLFSSDDLPASSAENYAQPHQKAQHKRTWYDGDLDHGAKRLCLRKMHDEGRSRSKGPLERSFDSGVFMNSDEAEEEGDFDASASLTKSPTLMNKWSTFREYREKHGSSSDPSADLERETYTWSQLGELASKYVEDPGNFEGPVWPFWQPQPENLGRYHALQRQATAKVGAAFDKNDNSVDLSDGGYEDIRAPTLRLLRYMTNPTVLKDGFGNLEPNLSLFLSNNALTEVPSEIYNLPGTRVLSLRCNKIQEILPGVGNLKKLEELNLGSNQLEWLPWEILSMLPTTDHKFSFFPNPFLKAMPQYNLGILGQKASQSGPSPARRRSNNPLRRIPSIPIEDPSEPCKPRYMASTRPAFLDICGRPVVGHTPSPTSQSSFWISSDISEPSSSSRPPPEQQKRTPSLLELSLRACSHSSNLSQAPFLLPRDASPHLIDLVKRTFKLRESGGQKCTVCSKPFIVPRTEWVEWWYVNPDSDEEGEQAGENVGLGSEPAIPFLRRGCSWRCWEEREGSVFTGWRSVKGEGGRGEGLFLRGGAGGGFTEKCLERGKLFLQQGNGGSIGRTQAIWEYDNGGGR